MGNIRRDRVSLLRLISGCFSRKSCFFHYFLAWVHLCWYLIITPHIITQELHLVFAKSPWCITVCSSLSQLLNNFHDKIYFKLLCSLYCNLSLNSIFSVVCDFVCKHFKLCPFFANQYLRYVATGHKGPGQDGGCRATFLLFCCANPAVLLTQTQVTNTRSFSFFHFAASQYFLKQVTMCS